MPSPSRFTLFLAAVLAWAHSSLAQGVPPEALLEGYFDRNDTTYFVFDARAYGVDDVERVSVTGAFRQWDADMAPLAWRLRPTDASRRLWLLPVANAGHTAIPPKTPFKFRTNEGIWMNPPAAAPNAEAGNLVYLKDVEPPRLRAELRGPRAVWATVTGDDVVRPLDVAAYRLTDGSGRDIPIAAVLPNTASQTLIVPDTTLDVRRVYYLELSAYRLRALCRRDPWFMTLYSNKRLGANVSHDRSTTTFRVFSPRADSLRLFLYRDADDAPEDAFRVVSMDRDDAGVWEAVIPQDLKGVYYDFTVHGPDDPGNYFFEAFPTHVGDPYARVSVDAWGKSRVWYATTPATPLPGGRPAMQDVVAYEVHVQDFTDRLPLPDRLRGTFTGMATPGLTNARGEPVGFDYLVGLGVNVVHLMPVQEYLHYRTGPWREAFHDDPYMKANGIADENYQWGYRTTHAFAIETRYREKGTEPGAQRDQLRDLVQAFHDHGLAVIVDLVPNHTGENMDGAFNLFGFNVFDLPYYYRTDDDLNHVGPFGNEVKTENRPMVQRWLIDQCRQLVDEIGIDGFRIDLAGQIDKQTLIALKEALPDDLILYGEPWIAPSDPDVAANPDWAWYKDDAPITFFQDEARNAFKGPTSDPENKATDRGYAGGNGDERHHVMQGLLNSFPDEVDPVRGINYLDIHDNWALADRFATRDWNGTQGVDEGPFRIAATLLLTSLGPVVLHGGTEMMRSKGEAELVEIHKEFDGAVLAFHGKNDTYNLRTPNQFVWDNVGKTPSADDPNDYAGMLAFWKGLIALRNSDAGSVFRIAEAPPEGYYRWLLPENERLLGYVVDEQVLVLVNVDEEDATFEGVRLPPGKWRLVADDDRIDVENGLDGTQARLDGAKAYDLAVAAQSVRMWVKE